MNQNSLRRKEGQMDGDGEDHVSERVGTGHRKQLELGRQDQDNLLGWSARVDSKGGGNSALMDFIGTKRKGEKV